MYATGPAVPHGTISHVPAKPIADIPGLTPLVARNTNILINREEKHQLPGSYKLLQEQIQENQAKSNKNNSYNSCNNNSISNCKRHLHQHLQVLRQLGLLTIRRCQHIRTFWLEVLLLMG